jgi:hypothetical protein
VPSSQNAPDMGFVSVGLAWVRATQVRAQRMGRRLERNPKIGPVHGVGQRFPSSRAKLPHRQGKLGDPNARKCPRRCWSDLIVR